MKQNSTKPTLEIIKTFTKGSGALFGVAMLGSILNTAFNSLTPQVIKITVDSVIGEEPLSLPPLLLGWFEGLGGREFFRSHLYVIAVGVVLLAILSGINNFISRTTIAMGAEGFVKRMRDQLFIHIQRLPYSWHVAHQTGDIIQRVTSDMEVVKRFISGQLIEAFRTLVLVIVTLSIMFSMNITLSLVAIGFIPLIVGYSAVFYGAIAKRFRETDEAEGALASVVQENLTGVRVVRAFGREGFETKKFDDKNNAYANIWIKLGYIMGAYWGLGDLFTGLQTMTVLVVGTYLSVQGQITIGALIAFLSYNSMLIWPIRGLGRILSEMSKSGVSFDRLGYILHAEEERDRPDAIEAPLTGDIVYQNVSFGYNDGTKVLDDLSFTIKGGSTVGILGGTGSGKSTLVHLLNRLYPVTEGSITIGGVDINQIKLAHLRHNIGMVLQEPFLFSRTIQQNIAIAGDDTDLAAIRHASSIAYIDEAIASFKDGYGTLVGERGVTLSGGQKQRVAIARMLMQRAPIMVFDDSLSAVDAETDYKIRTALNERQGDATVIIISHRITSLMQADQIIVLDEGKISQMGTHSQLIAEDGIYKEIYEIQLNSDDRLMTMGGDDNERI